MSSVLRILDANANRVREALRVMEEAARFLLDDAVLSEALKRLRHDFAQAVSSCDACNGMMHHRDTPGDVGTRITAEGEAVRSSPAAVAIAAGKRLSESLRAMEEYAKTLPPPDHALAGKLEALRYRGYDIEKKLNLAMTAASRLGAAQWRLCVLVTESLCSSIHWLETARAALQGGADCLQLREKELDSGELLKRAEALVKLAQPFGATVIINDRPDVALLSGAHGVHLGQTDLPCAQVRRLTGDRLIVGVSTSCLEDATEALSQGADYCGVGPMFPTTTKHKDVIVGPAYLRQYLSWGRLPHLAIGGIGEANLPQLIASGVQGVAVSAAVCAAADPAKAAANLLAMLHAHHPPSPEARNFNIKKN